MTAEGACVQLPLRVERGEERLRVLEGERSGGGKEEGWLRVETMARCGFFKIVSYKKELCIVD